MGLSELSGLETDRYIGPPILSADILTF